MDRFGGRTKMKYKLRAECIGDIINLLATAPIAEFKLERLKQGFPDAVFTFESNESLTELKARILDIPDSHAMLETLTLETEYTGERK